MKQLANLQRALQSHVLTGNRAALRLIVGSRSVPAPRRLRIYREAYYLRLNEALAANFPVLQKLLGADQFNALSKQYIDAYPSRNFSARYFGHRLPVYLSSHPSYRTLPILAELARWEWAMAAVFDARDEAAVEATALEGLAPNQWPQLRFEFQFALQLRTTRWNTSAVWSALSRDQTPPAVERRRHAATWALWRQGLEIFHVELEPAEARALRAALRSAPFSAVCALAPDLLGESEAALWAARMLRRWIGRGWIRRLQTGEAVAAPMF